MITRMEEDAANVLCYMASNGLVSNAKKTSMVILNIKSKKSDEFLPLQIKIGNDSISQERSAKLLGITFNDKQNWSTHING